MSTNQSTRQAPIMRRSCRQAVDEECLAMLLVTQDEFTLRETSAILILAMSKDAH